MFEDSVKKRLEALNRKPLRNLPHQESPEIRGLRRKITKQAERSAAEAIAESSTNRDADIAHTLLPKARPNISAMTSADPSPVRLEDVVAGRPAEAPSGPGYYLIELAARELEAEAAIMFRRFVSLTGQPHAQAIEPIASVCSGSIRPEEVLFLDLETTGLGTTPIFLVGTMECSAEGFHFRQYFARDYSEEISVLAAASERIKSAKMLITFNGKSFDEPYLRNRAAAVGIRMHSPSAHLDLLHEARHKYRRDLPNCRLQTLEQMICGRYREDDIPGCEIPAAYHEFVRTGNASRIQLILQHNLYDLLTMADLMNRLWYCE